MVDDFWTLDFVMNQYGQHRIAVYAGDMVLFELWPGQLDAAYRMCAWRNEVLTRASGREAEQVAA